MAKPESEHAVPIARDTRRLFGLVATRFDQLRFASLRNALETVELQALRPILHSVTRSALRSKSLSVDFELPFGIVSMDGKYVSVPVVDDRYSQRATRPDGETALRGRIGTMTATLSSSEARPCIDVYPVPAATNEMGVFARALDEMFLASPLG